MGRQVVIFLSAIAIFLITPLGHAKPLNALLNSHPDEPHFDVQFGAGAPFFNENSDNKQLIITGIETDTLHQNSSERLPIFHAGIDRIFYLHHFFNSYVAVGPHWYYQQVSYYGQVYQFGLPLLNNYTYKIHNRINDLLAQARWQAQFFNHHVKPYVLFGIGAGFIHMAYDDYANPDVPGGGLNLYNDETNLALAGGVGVDFYLGSHVDLGIGYIYLHNGEARINPSSSGRNLAQPFKLNTDSNNVMVNLGFSFG